MKCNILVKFAAMENVSKIEKFGAMVDTASRIAIVTHTHPDGDAAGSSTAIYAFLKDRLGRKPGVSIDVICEPLPRSIEFIASEVGALRGEQAAEAVRAADLIICTDFNVISRAGCGMEEEIRKSGASKILLDHHLNPETEAYDLVFSNTEVSSACEVCYEVLKKLGANFDSTIGRALMAGMTTDTNNFANSVFPSTLRMCSELIEAGVDRGEIVSTLYNNYRENRVRAFAYILRNNLTILDNGLAYITVSKEIWQNFCLEDGELEGLVNIPLSIGKVKMCVYLRESVEAPELRASVRSKKGWSANRVARTWFNGGGHELASGGKLRIPEDIGGIGDVPSFMEKIEI